MKIKIKYCTKWNYLPKAAGLVAEIKEEFNINPELVPGANGIFDVTLNGELIFSKNELKRFPKDKEVNKTINEKMKK